MKEETYWIALIPLKGFPNKEQVASLNNQVKKGFYIISCAVIAKEYPSELEATKELSIIETEGFKFKVVANSKISDVIVDGYKWTSWEKVYADCESNIIMHQEFKAIIDSFVGGFLDKAKKLEINDRIVKISSYRHDCNITVLNVFDTTDDFWLGELILIVTGRNSYSEISSELEFIDHTELMLFIQLFVNGLKAKVEFGGHPHEKITVKESVSQNEK